MHESGEDYLESVLRISRRKGNVRAIDIVRDLGVSKPSVSVAVHNLEDGGYLKIDGYQITLTDAGREIAERVIERHELFHQFLASLGVDDAVAEADACKIEHTLSVESFQAMKEFITKHMAEEEQQK
ncbi:MAG: metal-dependent transcriptional regulator [Lachnospiraceae bacterium]|nr:metal-dependent transcriptional regulator [Lachnospiraceae bacterium]